MNTFRTGLLMAAMTGLFVAVGYVVGGQSGMIFAFALAVAMNFFAYWNADKMVLSMYGAREVDEASQPDLVRIVRELSQKAGLPMPKVYIVDNPQPNAFATGRNPEHAAVCATTGLLSRVNNDELTGVLAHELSHVKNHDTLVMTLTATIAGAIGMLANFAFFLGGRRNNPLGAIGVLLVIVVAPLAAALVQMAISRTREYEADHSGALLSGRPLWLASALQHIQTAAEQIDNAPADAHPATAHMFIINPLHGGLAGLFSTHPPTEERIARLNFMAQEMGEAKTDAAPTGQHGPWG